MGYLVNGMIHIFFYLILEYIYIRIHIRLMSDPYLNFCQIFESYLYLRNYNDYIYNKIIICYLIYLQPYA
jgi:hypothetical protein